MTSGFIGLCSPEYFRGIDRTPVEMTLNRKLALEMGKLTAQDAVKSIQNSRRTPELVAVQLSLPEVVVGITMPPNCTNARS